MHIKRSFLLTQEHWIFHFYTYPEFSYKNILFYSTLCVKPALNARFSMHSVVYNVILKRLTKISTIKKTILINYVFNKINRNRLIQLHCDDNEQKLKVR